MGNKELINVAALYVLLDITVTTWVRFKKSMRRIYVAKAIVPVYLRAYLHWYDITTLLLQYHT